MPVEPREGAMKLNGITIRGRSVSGYGTSITLPDLGVSFDCGIANHDAVQCETVLITHAHLDHLGDIARHAYIRGMTGMEPTTFIVPEWLEGPVHEVFQFWAKVQEARKAPYTVKVARPGERVDIGKGRFVRSFKTIHRIRSQGYVLYEERTRLAAKYRGTPGKELGRLRREGAPIDEPFEFPLVGFTGDTRAAVYDGVRLEASVLIVECTFLDDVTVAEARKKGHTHITELAPKAERFDGVDALVLAHFSKRYSNRDIEAAIAKLPTCLREKTTYLPVGK